MKQPRDESINICAGQGIRVAVASEDISQNMCYLPRRLVDGYTPSIVNVHRSRVDRQGRSDRVRQFHTLRQPFHKPNEPGSERLFVHYDWCSFVPTLSPRGRRSPHVIVTRQEIAHRRTLSCDRTSDWLDPTLACTKDIHFLRVYSITTQFRILFVHFASPRCACIE